MNQFGRVAAYLASPYWYVRICTVHCPHSLTLHCALYTHQQGLDKYAATRPN